MKNVKIGKHEYVELGALDLRLLKGKASESSAPVDSLIKRIVKVLDSHGLEREISGVCWSSRTEKDYVKRLKGWAKRSKSYGDKDAEAAIAFESLNSFPLAVDGLEYNKLYYCLSSSKRSNAEILKGRTA